MEAIVKPRLGRHFLYIGHHHSWLSLPLVLAMNLYAPPAIAGLDLSWNTCNVDGGPRVLEVDCGIPASYDLVANFQVPETIDCAVLMDAEIELIIESSATYLDFWDMGRGTGDVTACNFGGFTLSTDSAAVRGGCGSSSMWGSRTPPLAAFGVFPVFQLNRARILMQIGWEQDNPIRLNAGQNYYAFHFVMKTDKSQEAGGPCHGCAETVRFEWKELRIFHLFGDPNAGCRSAPQDPIRDPGLVGNSVTWVGSTSPTPVVPTTWGRIKGLYR